MLRYSVITNKNPREIILLRGTGCRWRRCRFCDYHLDYSRNEQENFKINQSVLAQVTGKYHRLEVINSGSFTDLDTATFQELEHICKQTDISILHFECHWRDRAAIAPMRERFSRIGIKTQIKIGVESFDYTFRETVLDKGIDEREPSQIAALFDECCLLMGITGQTVASMRQDIEIALAHFNRVCINLMTPNTAQIQPDKAVCEVFVKDVAPYYMDNPQVDILLNNTDFGVG